MKSDNPTIFVKLQVVQLPPQSKFGTLSFSFERDCPHSPHLTPVLSSHPTTFSINLCALNISYKWDHTVFALLYLASFTQRNVVTKFTQTIICIRTTFLFHQLMDTEVDSCFSTASSTSAVVSCLLITAIFMGVKSFIAFDLHFSYDGAHIGIYLNWHLCIFFGEISISFKVDYLLIFILQEFFKYFGQQSFLEI